MNSRIAKWDGPGYFSGRVKNRKIRILDTTLRDGEQTPGIAFSTQAKVEIARALDELGVHEIDAGFAAVSESERRSLREISSLNLRANVMSLSRATPGDVDAAISCGIRYVAVFVALSDIHLEKKLHIDEAKAFDMVARALRYAKSKGVTFRFGVEDASRAPMDRLMRFYEMALETGAATIGYADTCGIDTPDSIYGNIEAIRKKFPDAVIGAHCHNDMGLAVANSLFAFKAGAQQIHVCMNGFGERAGNASLEEFVMALKQGYGVDAGIRTEKIFGVSKLVYSHARLEAPFNKPIVGKFVFSHESGIHAHGILSEPKTYEPFPPAEVGREHEILLGKHSGMSNLNFYLNRYFPGCELSEEQKQAVLGSIKSKAESIGLVSKEELGKLLPSKA